MFNVRSLSIRSVCADTYLKMLPVLQLRLVLFLEVL